MQKTDQDLYIFFQSGTANFFKTGTFNTNCDVYIKAGIMGTDQQIYIPQSTILVAYQMSTW